MSTKHTGLSTMAAMALLKPRLRLDDIQLKPSELMLRRADSCGPEPDAKSMPTPENVRKATLGAYSLLEPNFARELDITDRQNLPESFADIASTHIDANAKIGHDGDSLMHLAARKGQHFLLDEWHRKRFRTDIPNDAGLKPKDVAGTPKTRAFIEKLESGMAITSSDIGLFR